MKKFVFAALICLYFGLNVFAQAKIKVLKYEVPKYPAVAQATLISSEVVVLVKIDKEGKVISSNAESGHKFLKAAAEQSATKWLFSKDENLTEREVKITFAFRIKSNRSAKNNYKDTKIKARLVKPYCLEISATVYLRVNNVY